MIQVCFEVFSSPLGCNFPMGRDQVIGWHGQNAKHKASHTDDTEVIKPTYGIFIMWKQKYVNNLASSATGSYAGQVTFSESLFNYTVSRNLDFYLLVISQFSSKWREHHLPFRAMVQIN